MISAATSGSAEQKVTASSVPVTVAVSDVCENFSIVTAYVDTVSVISGSESFLHALSVNAASIQTIKTRTDKLFFFILILSTSNLGYVSTSYPA